MPNGPVRSIQGILAAAITPRRPSGHQIDLGAALELIDFLCSKRVQGILLLGSTGEFLHFDHDDRSRLVAMAVRRSRVPILVNVSHSTFDGAIRLAEEAGGAGAAGIVLMPPYFFRYGQSEVREFYFRFAAEAGARVPLYLYNIPWFTTDIECDTSLELLASGLFAGIKDSSGRIEDFARFNEFRKQQPFTFLMGADTIYARARQAGADGAVSGIASAVPELLLALDNAVQAGDSARVDRLQARVEEFSRNIDRFPVPMGIKAAASARGVKSGACAVPLSAERQSEMDDFVAWFREWLPVVEKECRS
jgi:4-hydroxy-tetrahydrodipicolinate synthase